MHLRKDFAVFFCLFAVLALCIATTGSAASLKERMLARVPAINALKDQGLVGENNQGYLEYRTGKQPNPELIQQENNDRRSVYAAIAQQQGVDAALVGQRRAAQIAEIGSPGHWFKKPDGSWYQKK